MTALITFDQYRLQIEYDTIEDDYYQQHGVDWQVVSGSILDKYDVEHTLDEQDLESTTQLFREYVDKLIKEELFGEKL